MGRGWSGELLRSERGRGGGGSSNELGGGCDRGGPHDPQSFPRPL